MSGIIDTPDSGSDRIFIPPGPFADDAEAAENGVPIGGIYNNSGSPVIRNE